MFITFGTITLVNAFRPFFNGRIDDQEIFQQEPLFRAAAAAFFDRGNNTSQLEFSVRWQFDNLTDALQFWLTHKQSLPTTENLTLRLDFTGTPVDVVYQNAGLELVSRPTLSGVDVLVTYRFLLPPPSAIFTPEDWDLDMRLFTFDIPADQDFVDISGQAWPAIPRKIDVSIELPSDDADGITVQGISSKTADGCRIKFISAPGVTGYKGVGTATL